MVSKIVVGVPSQGIPTKPRIAVDIDEALGLMQVVDQIMQEKMGQTLGTERMTEMARFHIVSEKLREFYRAKGGDEDAEFFDGWLNGVIMSQLFVEQLRAINLEMEAELVQDHT